MPVSRRGGRRCEFSTISCVSASVCSCNCIFEQHCSPHLTGALNDRRVLTGLLRNKAAHAVPSQGDNPPSQRWNKNRTKIVQKHHYRAQLSLFQLIQLGIKIGDVVNSLAAITQHFMQQCVTEQIDQTHGGGIAVKGGHAVQRRAQRPLRQ